MNFWHIYAHLAWQRLALPLTALAVGALLFAACGEEDEGSGNSSAEVGAAATQDSEPAAGAAGEEASAASPSGGNSGAVEDDGGEETEGDSAPSEDRSIQTHGRAGTDEERAAAGEVLHAYFSALADGEGEKACGLMASGSADQLAGMTESAEGKAPSCGDFVNAMTAGYPQQLQNGLRQVELKKLRVEDESAFAIYEQPGVPTSFIPMVLEDGEWRAAAIAGSVLP